MLHFQRENFRVDHRVGLPASFHHEVAGAVAVELGDCFEEIEEIGAVRLVESCDEARVDEDELRPVTITVDFLELGFPRSGVVSVGAQLLEDFFGHVKGVFGGRGFFVAT